MNANLMNSQFCHNCHFYDMEKFCDFFTLRPSYLITFLIYVLMDNFCPCFLKCFQGVSLQRKFFFSFSNCP